MLMICILFTTVFLSHKFYFIFGVIKNLLYIIVLCQSQKVLFYLLLHILFFPLTSHNWVEEKHMDFAITVYKAQLQF